MTESEAKDCMQGKLDCMNKCDVFDCKGTDECDSCNFCYAQGTFGEQKEALKMAIKALEKQIPMKHHHTNVYEVKDNIRLSLCPSCLYGTYTASFEHPKYCAWCGQAIDWE